MDNNTKLADSQKLQDEQNFTYKTENKNQQPIKSEFRISSISKQSLRPLKKTDNTANQDEITIPKRSHIKKSKTLICSPVAKQHNKFEKKDDKQSVGYCKYEFRNEERIYYNSPSEFPLDEKDGLMNLW